MPYSVINDSRKLRIFGCAGVAAAAEPPGQWRGRVAFDLLRQTVLRDFAEAFPQRFLNVTNGVTPRRFLMLSNPGLTRLLDQAIGHEWRTDLTQLDALAAHADDAGFHEAWRAIRRDNKAALALRIGSATGIDVDLDALFDIQVKRIHEYKRQHLNALYIISLYHQLCRNPAGHRAALLHLRRQGRAGIRDGQADDPPDHRHRGSRQP
jgi:glucan phosphorylase